MSSNVAVMARLSGLDEIADEAINTYVLSVAMILALLSLYAALYCKNKEQVK